MAGASRPLLSSWALLGLAAVLLAPAAQASSCPPEDCLPIVPFVDVPYLQGDVDFERFGATITVRDAIATTGLELTLRNPGTEATEVRVALPLPDGAAVLGFNLTIGDRLVAGRMLERGQAQAEYQEAVGQGRDAALLEQADKRLVSLTLNVGPGEQRVLRAAYAEPVPLAGGSRVYRLPLAQLDPLPDRLDVAADVSSRLGAANLRSTGLSLPLQAGKGAVSAAPAAALDDLLLLWEEEAGARSGLVSATPLGAGPTEALATVCLDGTPLARDVAFILDQSGSMAGLKMEEGRQALVAALGTVTPLDRYTVVPFSSDAVPFDDRLRAGTASNVAAAQARAARLDIEGGTNLDASIQEALRQLAAAPSDRLPMVVLLTDGLPTVGVVDHAEIIERARAANTRHAPFIVVPIGLDADYTFLAHLALMSGGAYVDPGAPDALLSDRLARLAEVLAGPVASDLTLTIDGAQADSVFPRVLPPVYAEDCLEVRFRTTGQGPVTLHLVGTGADGPVSLLQPFAAGDVAVQPAVRNLWGQALVADLLAQHAGPARSIDAALRAAVVANATAYGILTPYTAWVLVDDAPEMPPAPQEPTGGAGGTSAAVGIATGTSTGAAYAFSTGVQHDAGGDPNAAVGQDNKTPGPGAALLVLALVGLAAAMRRR